MDGMMCVSIGPGDLSHGFFKHYRIFRRSHTKHNDFVILFYLC